MICVSYTRTVSCKAGRKKPSTSIREQSAHIQEYVKERGWTLIRKYSDRKITTDDIAGFTALQNDGAVHAFEVVVVDSLFFFGNSLTKAKHLIYDVFLPAGIHFAVVEDDICSLDCSREQFKEYLYRKDRENAISASNDAVIKRLENNQLPYNEPRYGYMYTEEGQIIVDETAASVIREIFQMLMEDISPRMVAEKLNCRGIDPPRLYLSKVRKSRLSVRNHIWTEQDIRSIYSCTAYIGFLIRRYEGKEYRITVPAIIEQKDYDYLRQRRRGRYQGKREKEVYPNPLGGMVWDVDSGKQYKSYSDISERKFYLRSRYTEETISSREVMDEVVAFLHKEKEAACIAFERLKGGEGVETYKKYKEELVSSLKTTFLQEDEIAVDRIGLCMSGLDADHAVDDALHNADMELEKLEAKMDEIVMKLRSLDKAYTDKNDWLRFFLDIDIPKELTRSQVLHWIRAVKLKDGKVFNVETYHGEQKLWLPNDWW